MPRGLRLSFQLKHKTHQIQRNLLELYECINKVGETREAETKKKSNKNVQVLLMFHICSK